MTELNARIWNAQEYLHRYWIGYPNTDYAVSGALESQTPNDEIGCQARRRRRAQHSRAGSRRNNAWHPSLAISKRRLPNKAPHQVRRRTGSKPKEEIGELFHFKNSKGILFFVLILIGIAFTEEYLWEIFVWNENINIGIDAFNWQFLLVPLLTVPQFTHYLLDGFIWKNNK